MFRWYYQVRDATAWTTGQVAQTLEHAFESPLAGRTPMADERRRDLETEALESFVQVIQKLELVVCVKAMRKRPPVVY